MTVERWLELHDSRVIAFHGSETVKLTVADPTGALVAEVEVELDLAPPEGSR
jgi:hypothetical protein